MSSEGCVAPEVVSKAFAHGYNGAYWRSQLCKPLRSLLDTETAGPLAERPMFRTSGQTYWHETLLDKPGDMSVPRKDWMSLEIRECPSDRRNLDM